MGKKINKKSIEQMAVCLCEIKEFAASALAHRPARSGADLLRLTDAIEKIRAKLSPPELKYFTPKPALDAVAGARPLDAILANPPFSRPDEEKKRGKQVGITTNDRHILVWNYTDNMDIRVEARKLENGGWAGRLHSNGQERASIVVNGGKWLTNALCKGLRNSMTSWRKKRHRNNANRAARGAVAPIADKPAENEEGEVS